MRTGSVLIESLTIRLIPTRYVHILGNKTCGNMPVSRMGRRRILEQG
jgi:hypothetical protein